jgi:type I restriction enzyme M protein
VNDDSLMNPMHQEQGQIKTFDIVIANPPFSQNYSTDDMKYKERFSFWIQQKGRRGEVVERWTRRLVQK